MRKGNLSSVCYIMILEEIMKIQYSVLILKKVLKIYNLY